MSDFLLEKDDLKLKQTGRKLLTALTTKFNIFAYEINDRSVANFALNSYYGGDLYDLLKRIELSKKELLWYLIQKGSKLPAAKFSNELSALSFERCEIPEFLNDLITGKDASSKLYDFVSDAYDELVEEDKAKWKNRIEAIDALVGNIDVYFEVFDDLCDDDFDADE